MKPYVRTGAVAGVAALGMALLPAGAAPAAQTGTSTVKAADAVVKKGKIRFCSTGSGTYNYEADGTKFREGAVDVSDCDTHKVPKGTYEVVLSDIVDGAPACAGAHRTRSTR